MEPFVSLDALPTYGEKRVALHVKSNVETTLRKGHPWLFDQAITKQSHEGKPGDLAVLYDHKNKFLGIGLYDPFSPIRVKVLQVKQSVTIGQAWFENKLREAVAKRADLPATHTNGYRLVHGENDGLPALIIDRYAQTLVIKVYSVAWIPHLRALLPALEAVFPSERWVLRLARNVSDMPEYCYGLTDGQILKGDPLTTPILFEENGLKFTADVVHGHKTGFFFDQRDNRHIVGELANDRTVLDIFSYVGAFSLYAVQGGAKSVLSVDISAPALDAMQANFALNADQLPNVPHDILATDAFQALSQLSRQGRTFDMVIIDPPSFAKSQAEVAGALNAYTQLTGMGLDVLAEGGILVMASCSSRVSSDEFFGAVINTVKRSGRKMTEIRRTTHAVDHPIGFPEGAYLKCWFAKALD